jgi:precorrin-2 dehydrogenase/sirohydrochlorin ferrochelatase
MLPLFFVPEKISVLVVGCGKQAEKRISILKSLGIHNLTFININKDAKISKKFVKTFTIAFITDPNEFDFIPLYNFLRPLIPIINVEDKLEYCDFYFPSIVNKGKLKVAISTAGESPFFGKFLKQKIEDILTEELISKFENLAKERKIWKKQGLALEEIAKKSEKFLFDNIKI